MAKPFKRNKPFAEVCGGTDIGYKYQQDGRFFNQAEEEVNKNGKLMSQVKADKANAPKDGGKPNTGNTE